MSETKQITLGLTLREAYDMDWALLISSLRKKEEATMYEQRGEEGEDIAVACRNTAESLERIMNNLEGLIKQIVEGEKSIMSEITPSDPQEKINELFSKDVLDLTSDNVEQAITILTELSIKLKTEPRAPTKRASSKAPKIPVDKTMVADIASQIKAGLEKQ